MRNKNSGFSMVEMIVALVISAFLGLAIYTTFAQGLRIWNRVAKDRPDWKISLFLDKLTEELGNEFVDPKWNFQGDRTWFRFAAIEHKGLEPNENELRDRPVYLRYGFDAGNGVITLQKLGFKDLFAAKPSTKAAFPVLEKIHSFGLEYYTYDARAKGYRWKTQWNKNCFPGTVKVTIEPEEADNRKVTRIIEAPAGDVCQE